MAPQVVTDRERGEGDFAWTNNAVYEATHTAIEAIEKAYDSIVSQTSDADAQFSERFYASKAAAKLSVFEVASRAISVMAVVPPEKKATIAATAIATIRQIQLS